MNKKIFSVFVLLLSISFSTTAFASLTFTTDAITGTTASTIDLGAGNDLSLQTIGNGVITTGTGLVTLGGGLNVAGSLGIGTTTPITKLELSGDGAILATGSYGSGWTEPNLGGGTRMMWYPAKAAFRAGSVSDVQWNNSNIGIYSVAMGYRTTASGISSTAIGESTTASASNSTAMGYQNIASGNGSTALGSGFTTASGIGSLATGTSTTASGDYSVAMGMDTNANSFNSVSLGRYNVGGGTAGSWVATDPLFEIGIGANLGSKANALTVLKNGNIGIGTITPGASSILDISSITKGVVLPRMTKVQRDAIATPVAGMAIYQTDAVPGLRVYNGTNWMRFTETID